MTNRSNFRDLTGSVHGRLTVISRALNNKYGSSRWNCICECGTETIVTGGNLSGSVKSCGCLRREVLDHTTHGMTETAEFKAWTAMKTRCLNENIVGYKYWGGRGITVCPQWLDSFDQFYADMGPRPDGMTLDRIDNDGNYEPNNCRWVNIAAQNRNKRPRPPGTGLKKKV